MPDCLETLDHGLTLALVESCIYKDGGGSSDPILNWLLHEDGISVWAM